jgi:hypothetical protein
MANVKFLDVDDKGEDTLYPTHAEVLNNVSKKKTKDGNPYRLAINSVWEIADKKRMWFPPIATSDIGGWKTPDHINWINIPSPDKCTITQIPLENCESEYEPIEDFEYAVFNCVKTDESDKSSAYRFFGIYKRIKTNEKNHITIWKRISDTLDKEEWKATNNSQ